MNTFSQDSLRLRNIIVWVCVLQAGCPSKACCFSTRTSWARWCLGATPRRRPSPRPTSATMPGSAWAAGACASTHLVLLFTQVSTQEHELTNMVNFLPVYPGMSCVFLCVPQPSWRNWKNASLCAPCTSSPTWRSAWARVWPRSPPTCTWCCLFASPMESCSPRSARCLIPCSANITRAHR